MRSCTLIMLGAMLGFGCGSSEWKRVEQRDWANFKAVKIGMSKERVEALIGPPLLIVDNIAMYGSPVHRNSWQSPALEAFTLTYSNNIVLAKNYYGKR